MSKTEKIIERKTPIPGEVERYVWLDGALARIEDLHEPTRMDAIIDITEWIRFKWMYQLAPFQPASPVPSME